MKCGNVNRDGRKQTLDARFILWFGSTQSLSYSTLLKHSRRVSLLGHQVSPGSLLASPPRLASHHSHLGPGSTMELLYEGWGSPHPPHKDVDAAPHQVGGSLMLPTIQQSSKGLAHRALLLVHSRTTSQGTTPCCLTH